MSCFAFKKVREVKKYANSLNNVLILWEVFHITPIIILSISGPQWASISNIA